MVSNRVSSLISHFVVVAAAAFLISLDVDWNMNRFLIGIYQTESRRYRTEASIYVHTMQIHSKVASRQCMCKIGNTIKWSFQAHQWYSSIKQRFSRKKNSCKLPTYENCMTKLRTTRLSCSPDACTTQIRVHTDQKSR